MATTPGPWVMSYEFPNPKKSKNMGKKRVEPQEIEKRRSVVLINDKKSKNMKPWLVQLQKIRKYELAARYNEEKSKNAGKRTG